MLEKLIELSIRWRWFVLLAVTALAVLGVWSFQRLPIDATPDITNVQVQINIEAPGYSPLEAEQRLTFPVETAIAGMPGLQYTRSISRYGLSQVTVVFDDSTDIYFARQLLNERLRSITLPPGITPISGRSRRGWARSSSTRSSLRPGLGNRMERSGLSRTCACSRIGSSGRSFASRPVSPT